MMNNTVNYSIADVRRLPAHEEPFEVPSHWVWTTLNDILPPMETRDPLKFQAQEFLYIDIDAIDNSIQRIREAKRLPVSEAPSRAKRAVHSGDVIISLVRPYLKNVALIDEKLTDAVASTAFYVCGSSPLYDSRFLYEYLRSPFMTTYLIAHTKGDNAPSVRNEDFLLAPIPLPPLDEQKRIVERIESLLGKIEEAAHLIDGAPAQIKVLEGKLLVDACLGNLTETWRLDNGMHKVDLTSLFEDEKYEAPSWGNAIPHTWGLISLSKLIESGPQNGLYKPQSAYGEGTMIVRIDNFYDGTINDWETLKKLAVTENEISLYGLNNNDVLINRVNSIQFLGKSALVRNLRAPCVFESNMMRLRLKREYVNPEYAVLFLKSILGIGELRKNAKHAVNQSSINQTDVKAVVVPLPPLHEQDEIVRIVQSQLTKVQRVADYCSLVSTSLTGTSRGVMSKAFRGEL